MCGDRFAA
jgi:ketosteroid isomerase-like protein